MNAKLDETIEKARRVISRTDINILTTNVAEFDKKQHRSGGVNWESILTPALSPKDERTPKVEVIDRPERHSIAGGMNDPSPIQVEAFKEDTL